MAVIHVTDASGRQWDQALLPSVICTIGRSPDTNRIVLNDVQVSRQHAHIKHEEGAYVLVDGAVADGVLRRSANHVFVNGQQCFEHRLKDGDRITLGASTLQFEQVDPAAGSGAVDYDDDPLGSTQVLLATSDLMTDRSAPARPTSSEEESLQRKANVLSLLYEMSKTLGSVFTLDAIFEKAT